MFKSSDIATAQIAQLFGSELLKVQNSAITDSGSPPNIVNLDPKQFLIPQGSPASFAQKQHEEVIMRQLQAEAESTYPLPLTSQPPPQPVYAPPPVVPPPVTEAAQIPITNFPIRPIQSHGVSPLPKDAMERIACSLESIAESLAKIDFTVKKKRSVKRKQTIQ
jgi:hypothetical protein